jgi:hypothetical protein
LPAIDRYSNVGACLQAMAFDRQQAGSYKNQAGSYKNQAGFYKQSDGAGV